MLFCYRKRKWKWKSRRNGQCRIEKDGRKNRYLCIFKFHRGKWIDGTDYRKVQGSSKLSDKWIDDDHMRGKWCRKKLSGVFDPSVCKRSWGYRKRCTICCIELCRLCKQFGIIIFSIVWSCKRCIYRCQ